MDYAEKFRQALDYTAFLDRYANDDQRSRWDAFHAEVSLTDPQKTLLHGFQREMKVLVLAGAWCGDCVNQCPIFDHVASQNDNIHLRFLDRDDNDDLASQVTICGGKRVPTVIFLSEDDHFCGSFGDRTLAKYRQIVSEKLGAACPTGIGRPEQSLTEAVVQEWIDQFERIQLMLRTSGRLREKHGD